VSDRIRSPGIFNAIANGFQRRAVSLLVVPVPVIWTKDPALVIS